MNTTLSQPATYALRMSHVASQQLMPLPRFAYAHGDPQADDPRLFFCAICYRDYPADHFQTAHTAAEHQDAYDQTMSSFERFAVLGVRRHTGVSEVQKLWAVVRRLTT